MTPYKILAHLVSFFNWLISARWAWLLGSVLSVLSAWAWLARGETDAAGYQLLKAGAYLALSLFGNRLKLDL